jgi:NAD(P)-dependent dehydrogenase (short-subunit alcohol dehydrogenase family)
MKLKDRVAIITGAASGMGEATAKVFAIEGAKVVVSDIDEENVNRVVEDIKSDGGEAIGFLCDVGKKSDILNLVEKTIEVYNGLDIVMNNAGIMDNFYPVGDLDEELWDRVLNVNLKGPYLLSKEAIRYFLNNQIPGVIINIASVGGFFGARGGASYVASKHGLIGLTKNTASAYKEYGIRCNAIAPGGVKTGIGSTITAPHRIGVAAMAKGTGEAPMGDPEDIAYTALYLASDESKFTNGTTITVDGGWTSP